MSTKNDNGKRLQDWLLICALFLWGLIAIAAGSGAMSYAYKCGEGFYWAPGVLNILINAVIIGQVWKAHKWWGE